MKEYNQLREAALNVITQKKKLVIEGKPVDAPFYAVPFTAIDMLNEALSFKDVSNVVPLEPTHYANKKAFEEQLPDFSLKGDNIGES